MKKIRYTCVLNTLKKQIVHRKVRLKADRFFK